MKKIIIYILISVIAFGTGYYLKPTAELTDVINTDINTQLIEKNDTVFDPDNMEASPFVWNGELKYFIAERNDAENFYQLAIFDFKTRKRIATFGEGLGLGAATVIDDTLYVTATEDWFNFGNSKVYLFTSKDLKTFSDPQLILEASENQKIFNTSLTKNSETGQLVLSYEYQDDVTVPFSIKFLVSNDGKNWQKFDSNPFGPDVYVACPFLKYLDGYYYMVFLMEDFNDPNCPTCLSYVAKIARSQDLISWTTSPRAFLTADRKNEGINNSDIDMTEFENKTVIFYAAADQVTWAEIKYAYFNGTMKTLFESFFLNTNPNITVEEIES